MSYSETLTCGTPMTHPDKSVSYCTLPKDHYITVEDSDHCDEHGHTARVLVRQATIREVAAITSAREHRAAIANWSVVIDHVPGQGWEAHIEGEDHGWEARDASALLADVAAELARRQGEGS
jgi:hypothetical protein